MTVSETIKAAGITPSADYTGVEMADDFLLAIQTEPTQTDVKSWVVCADHVKSHAAALNASTADEAYIRTGTASIKTNTQRTFTIEGDRQPGDPFQAFALSHRIVYGTGQEVVVPYVYFSLRTGKGEKGTASLIVNADADGAAGEKAAFKIDMKATARPDEYTYTAD